MTKYLSILACLFTFIFSSCAQNDLKSYEGNWEGTLSNAHTFNFDISLKPIDTNTYHLFISNKETTFNKKLTSNSNNRIQLNLDVNTHFNLSYNNESTEITGFITSGILMYHISLKKSKDGVFTGTWNPFMVDNLQSQSVFISFENYDDGSFATYPIFGDQRFTGTWANDFVKSNNVISFRDFKTGLKFKVTLFTDKIQLDILLSENTIAVTHLIRSDVDLNRISFNSLQNQNAKRPKQINDGWETARIEELDIEALPLIRMIDSINKKSLVNTHSVLISKKDKLVFEAYFDGYNYNIPHDQRSASKSIASAMTGIAINDNILKNDKQPISELLPEIYKSSKDSLRSKIRIKDLLTMSSGIDAIDFGIDGNSAASEDSYQSSNDWLKTVMDASMINSPGTHAFYGSANPFLLGVCLNEQLNYPLELYMDQKLLAPLGISNYIIQTENTATTPYFGGGMYLTPRAMLKFGQLYLNKGYWKGQQLISEDWINDSFQKYMRLENTNDKNEYGYLWWHKTYTVGNKHIEAIEARGAGGQYIFVIPELESVVVITSGNFRNGKFQQPEDILEQYILPAIVN
ncbi:serine hydrolase [uncultured Psychroserpens sp.]|uniref:serine hydrolase domain-containing protein n=1 Tax=uncultured Psychroserpens sp. TaxID=255436 RepID=UPI00260AD040|nr:serine hydrolase [uncultured Psychroserpens sp.]